MVSVSIERVLEGIFIRFDSTLRLNLESRSPRARRHYVRGSGLVRSFVYQNLLFHILFSVIQRARAAGFVSCREE